MKQNDWIVATLNNPSFDVGDFQHISGMTLDNTQLLSRDQYLQSRYIRENPMFTNDRGEFQESLFNKFYDSVAPKFAEFSTENIVDNYEYSMWDVLRPKNGRVKDINFTIGTQNNPDHITIGVAGFNEVADSGLSRRELAQRSKIRNSETGEYYSKSVNDLNFFEHPIDYIKSLFDEPLVYATYDHDEEEIDPITGNVISHKKGEWKVNEDGEYYTETLNGRSLLGKQVVTASDYLTSETSSFNKYDFMDSDGIDKSVGGTIARNLAVVLPMFIPYVNTAYSGLLVGRELAKSLPMLYGIATGLAGAENTDSKYLNIAAAYGERLTGSTSDYAQNNTFSFENFGNLMSDVALQWGQQKFIANTFSKLSGGGERAINTATAKAQNEYIKRAKQGIEDVFSGKMPEDKLIQYIGTSNPVAIGKEMIQTGKWAETPFGKAALNKYLPAAQKLAESRMRTGQDLSLVYMAIISNTDVYQSVLEKGGTPREAAAIALGSTIGMFSVDKYLGLGEMFFNDEPARRAIRESARRSAEQLMSTAGIRQAETQTKKGIMGLIQKGIESGKKAVADYHTQIKDRSLGFIGKSLGEGLEEVSEELVSDLSKYMGELAGQLGYFSRTDYGAGLNAFERYTMSFLGGAAGGGMFYGVDLVTNRNSQTKDFQNELTYLLRQGKKDEILAELDRLKKAGKLGSKDLSYNTTTDASGNKVYLTADTEEDSQSTYVYNTLKKTINQLDMILNENLIGLSDDELFDRMVQGEYRANALTDFLKGNSEDLKEVSYITRYQEDFQNLTQDIINKESEIQELLNTTPDPTKRGNPDFQEKMDKLKAEKEELLKQRDYLFGEGSLGYVEKMLFAMDAQLSGQFVNLTYNQFVRYNTGKAVKDLTQQEQEHFKKLYQDYSKAKKMDLDQAFKLFKEMLAKINPEIQNLVGRDFSTEIEQFKVAAELDPFAQWATFDTKLTSESQKDFDERYIKRDNETDEQFQARILARQEAIRKYNDDHLFEWINNLSLVPIDRSSFRTTQARIGLLRKSVYNELIERLTLPNNAALQQKIWSIIKAVGTDGKDRRELYKQLRAAISESMRESFLAQYKDRLNLDQWDMMKQELEFITGMYPDTPITKGDVYTWIDAWIENQHSKGNMAATVDDAVAVLEAQGWDFNPDTEQGIVNNQAVDFYNRVASGITAITDPEADEVIEITEDFMEAQIKQLSEEFFKQLKDTLTKDIFKGIRTDKRLKALTNLESVAFINNPLMPVMKQISQKLRNSDVDIETFLEEIYQLYTSGESARDFQFTDPQLLMLEQFSQDLEMAKAFIYAASTKSSYSNPVGHNKSVNEFVKNHSDVFGKVNPLPEIDELTANFLINEANIYKKEIDSWRERHQRNTADKVKKFIDSDLAFNKARLEYYKVNRDAFKISPTLDLLDGYKGLALDDSLTSIVQIGELLHRNFKKAIKNGTTLELILDVILPKITNLEALKTQMTAKLDDTITYSKLTDYDKLALLISNFAIGDSTFYTNLKDFITANTSLAPLSLLEYASKLALAQLANPEIINKTLLYLNNKLGLKLPVLLNTTIITGVGGAGKTQAVAKLSTSNGLDTWLSGPTQSQIDGLLAALPKGQGFTKQQLFETILGKAAATEFLNSVVYDGNTGKWIDKTGGKYFTKVPGLDGNSTVVLKDSVKVNKITNAPKLLIIDEATHFNTAELQLVSKFAHENGITVYLLGDDNQNGFGAPKLMENFGREFVLGWRTPKLFISLRDNNILKMNNLQSTIDIMDQLQSTSGQDELANMTKRLLDGDFKQYALKYYNGDKFFGELITDNISPELMAKLDGEIGFIGTEQSAHYQQLKNAGKNVKLVNPIEVQGREFDYVIVDKDWKLNIDLNNLALTGIDMYQFFKDLYTMISRSRKGTILIDRGLSSIVGNIEDQFTGESSNIKDAVEKFRQTRLQQIEQALAAIEPETDDDTTSTDDDSITETDATVDQVEDDSQEGQDNDDARRDEVKEAEDEEAQTYENLTTPIRVYSNVSYSGIDTTADVWENPDDSMKDLGIFLRAGQTISSGRDKYELVKRLIELKSIFNYGTIYYDRLPPETKRLISKEAFDNAEYYVSVEDESPSNSLVGLTDLDQDKRTIGGKVVTLAAKIQGRNGETFTVTLGGLANPETWKKGEASIRAAIQKKIDAGIDNADELRQYLAELSNNILAYENKITRLVKKNQEFRINKPNFSGLTSLVHSRGSLRLESINSEYSPFDGATSYAVKSRIYAIVDDIPGIKMTYLDKNGVEHSLKGRAVMYVSSNPLLTPDELEKLYMAQKNDPSMTPQVRMIVLNNEGVSFTSLYRKKYKDLYTISTKGVKYRLPFDSEPMAIRMYASAWNFRANLKKFLLVYGEWVNNSGLTPAEVEDLCKLDNALYQALVDSKRELLKQTAEYNSADAETREKMLRQVYVSETEYRGSLTDELRNKVKPIWDFNDSLASNVRQFRLGYSSQNGAYIRKLTNLKAEDGLYKDVDNTLGIYINPSLATQYDKVLDALFENILNKIVPTDQDAMRYMDGKLMKGWFEKVTRDRSLQIKMYDDKGNEVNSTLNLPGEDILSALPVILIEVSKYIGIRGLDPDAFDQRLAENPNSRYFIKLGDEILNWGSLAEALDGGQMQLDENIVYHEGDFPPGIRPLTEENGAKIGLIDRRIENMFNLMFHGMVSTYKENDFDKSDIRATDARFRLGFFADPILVQNDGTEKSNAPVATNRKLFSSNVVPGLPIIGISLDAYQETALTEEGGGGPSGPAVGAELEGAKAASISILADSGITLVDKALAKVSTIQDLYNLVNSEISAKFTQYFEGHELSPLEKLITGVKINGNTLEFTYFTLSPELNGKTIQSYEWQGKTLHITTTDGTKYSVQNILGRTNWSEISEPNAAERTVGLVISQINDALSVLSDFIEPSEMQSIQRVIQDAFRGNQPTTVASEKLVAKAINSVLEELNKMADDSDAEWTSVLNKALSNLKNVSCIL